eukprot:2888209-Amphidinium_carterae.1
MSTQTRLRSYKNDNHVDVEVTQRHTKVILRITRKIKDQTENVGANLNTLEDLASHSGSVIKLTMMSIWLCLLGCVLALSDEGWARSLGPCNPSEGPDLD